MNYTKVNGLNISKLTLGTVQLGMEYGIANKSGKPDMKKAFKILQTAINSGINSFDTASAYGNSEEVLGDFFTSVTNKSGIIFTTKFKVASEDKLTDATIEKQIYNYVERSLERLKIEKIPIYMLHNAKDMTQYGEIVPDTLKKLKREGLIGKAGVSVYNPEEVEEMLKDDLYEAVQIPMNMFDQRMVSTGMLDKLKDANIIVFVRSVFLQGLFFLDPMNLPVKLKMAKEPLLLLHKLAERENMGIAQMAISYIRDMEGVSSLVLGVETPEQIIENVKLINTPSISLQTRDELERCFKSVPILEIMEGLK